MKKIYFVIAALAAVTLSSCVKEKSFNDVTPLGKDDIAFSLQSAATRSADTMAPERGMTIKLNSEVCLEETIEEMDYAAPATRGVPAYTFNVGKIYKTMGVYGDSDGFGTATFERMDTAMVANGWRYWHNYGSADPWPADKEKDVDFYFSMPAQANGVTELDYADQQITFTFDSPTNGAAQQDILFSHTAVSKNDHDGFLPNGAPVTMYHALTGVKFRNGHSNDGTTKTIIKSVKFKGLRSHGLCTVTPAAIPEGSDVAKSKDKVKWEGLDNATTFTLDFTNPSYYVDSEGNPVDADAEGKVINTNDGTVSYGSGEGKVPTYNGTSWTAAAADHNLNDEEGSMTFWFIPQEIDENVTLEITFLVKTPDTPDGTEVPHVIDFGKLVTQTETNEETGESTKKYTEWKAGQLRTYTLKPFDVDVEIFDKMTNLTKDNLHVTNTGNVNEYVRIMVIGNWYGWKPGQDRTKEEPSIMVGYQYPSPEAAAAAAAAAVEAGGEEPEDPDPMVKPWFREDDYYGQFFDKTFKGGRPVAEEGNLWLRGTGGYFYYPNVIGVGQQLSGTQALFEHYELKASDIPTIYIPVSNSTTRQAAVGVHLVMEIVVQAIPTTKPNSDETFADCWEAWSYAVGKEIKKKD